MSTTIIVFGSRSTESTEKSTESYVRFLLIFFTISFVFIPCISISSFSSSSVSNSRSDKTMSSFQEPLLGFLTIGDIFRKFNTKSRSFRARYPILCVFYSFLGKKRNSRALC
uniref:Uncharacterized protein n=1 Tax=Cacopsylla melanoneura TaxID=428564 RepID=A0A8D9BDL9_9HEMI